MSVLNEGREVIGREEKGGFIKMLMKIGKIKNKRGLWDVMREIKKWKRKEEEMKNERKEEERE